jgi:alpha-tubulin suppressor-like RCC1 family protein
MFLADKGKVYGWGNSEYGQLPTKDDNSQINIATELKICQEMEPITDIAAGGCFCMILNSKYYLIFSYYKKYEKIPPIFHQ